MMWAILSILSGAGDAVAFASIKKLNQLGTRMILLLRHLVTLPFLLLGFLFYKIPKVSSGFYLITLANVIIFLIAMYLLVKSIRMSDLSVSIPMLNLTPTFLLLTSYIMLGEAPSVQGVIGIFITIIGCYIVNLRYAKRGYFEPFKMISKNKEVVYMIIVAFLFSITSNLVKIGIKMSNPAYFIFINYLFASVILIALFFREFENTRLLIKNTKWILTLGVSTAIMEMLIAVAVNFSIIPYILTLKRTSVIFSVLIGFLFFKEKNVKEAIIGAVIMFIGVLLITLS